jgi:hypothetical protein
MEIVAVGVGDVVYIVKETLIGVFHHQVHPELLGVGDEGYIVKQIHTIIQ